MMSVQPRGPLSGYRILELATTLSGPIGAMLLADQGADVIKLESPGGDQLRNAGGSRKGVAGLATMFLNANRNKRSIVVDLKSDEGRDTARSLAAASDVVIQNFRPGVVERLGLSYDDLRKLRPDLIYVSIDGVGEVGPDRNRRVYDTVVQALSGFAAAQADRITGAPGTVQNAVVDKATSMTVWQAVTAALLHRERTGEGQHVRISMLSVALSFLWPETMSGSTLIGDDVRKGGSMSAVQYVFPTQDGHVMVGFVGDEEFAAVARVVERPEWIDDPRFSGVGPRFANAEELNALLAERLTTRSSDDWLDRLREADAVFAPVNSPDTVHLDPQVVAIGAIEEHDHPVAGRIRQPAHPIRFGASPAAYQRHAPALGEHTDEILAELAADAGGRP